MSQYRATVLIYYPKVEASVVPNYLSKNKKIRDNCTVADALIKTYVKPLLESTVTLSDILLLDSTKVLLHNVYLTEVRAIIVEKDLLESLHLTENTVINLYAVSSRNVLNTTMLNVYPLN